MKSNLEELKNVITRAYTEGVTVPEAEKYAAQTLMVRMEIAEQLKSVDLDARMKKHGVKAVRGEIYLEEIGKHEKKPNEAYLESVINLDGNVTAEELRYAKAEVESDYLHAMLGIFSDAHIYFRAVMKGTYDS